MSEATETNASVPEDEEIEVYDDTPEAAATPDETAGKPAKAAAAAAVEPDEDELADLDAHEPDADPDEHDGRAAPKSRAIESRLRRERDAIGRQMSDMASQMAAIRKAQTEQKLGELAGNFNAVEGHLRNLNAQKAQAFQRQDFNAAVAIDEQINEFRGRRANIAAEHERIRTAPEPAAPVQGSRELDRDRMTRLSSSWAAKRPWFDTSKKDSAEFRFVQAASNRIAEQGTSADSPEHYAELDRIVKAQFPSRYRKADAGETRQKPRALVSGSSSSGAAPAPSTGGKIRVPSSLIDNARKAGLLDGKNDKAVLKRLAAEYQSISGNTGKGA